MKSWLVSVLNSPTTGVVIITICALSLVGLVKCAFEANNISELSESVRKKFGIAGIICLMLFGGTFCLMLFLGSF